MKKIFLLLFLFFTKFLWAQYDTQHFIAPAPWQYWNTANEIVIGTMYAGGVVDVELLKSDGTFVANLSLSANNPVSYRFTGNYLTTQRNQLNAILNDAGLIVNATAPVMVNLRNIASDAPGSAVTNIKGNASLVSFGKESLGLAFRVGYYRPSTTGLIDGAPIYSVMATEDNTTVNLPLQTIMLGKGQSYLFKANIGDLVTSDKLVVMNTSSAGDTPQLCGFNLQDGEDGTFDQIAPVEYLGDNYLVVRGEGQVPTAAQMLQNFGSEQTTIVTTQANTIITITHFDANGVIFGTPITQTIANAGGYYTFYHGDGSNMYSASLINSTSPVIVYAGTAVDCETDISTVLPIGGCSGALNIQTKKFIDFNNNDLPYFGFSVIESATVPVLLNGQSIETITGVPRRPLGNSGFYMITFNDQQLNNPANLIITSTLPITTSLVQQGSGFSMSAFFSSFGQPANSPVVAQRNADCSVTLVADDGFPEYVWFLNGKELETTQTNTLTITKSGDYAVKVRRDCGLSGISKEEPIEITPCSDLKVDKKRVKQQNLDVTFTIEASNINPHFTEQNAVVTEKLPAGFSFVSATTTKGTYDDISGLWTIGQLAPNEIQTLTINCKIEANNDYVNTAIITGTLEDTNAKNNKSSATIEALIADIDAVKDDGKLFYFPGETLNYKIKVLNKGPQKALNVIVSDPVPHNASSFQWKGNGKQGNADLYDSIEVLEAGQEIVYEVSLQVPNSHEGFFTNTVFLSSEYIQDPNPDCTHCVDTNIPEFNVPRGISPNGDGNNDYLDLTGYSVSKLKVFNRYGSLVYEKDDYSNQWHGQDNADRILPSGTYFYVVYVNKLEYKSGYIQIMHELN